MISDVDFAALVSDGVNRLGLQAVADGLLQDVPTIERWAAGTALPQPHVKMVVSRWLRGDRDDVSILKR